MSKTKVLKLELNPTGTKVVNNIYSVKKNQNFCLKISELTNKENAKSKKIKDKDLKDFPYENFDIHILCNKIEIENEDKDFIFNDRCQCKIIKGQDKPTVIHKSLKRKSYEIFFEHKETHESSKILIEIENNYIFPLFLFFTAATIFGLEFAFCNKQPNQNKDITNHTKENPSYMEETSSYEEESYENGKHIIFPGDVVNITVSESDSYYEFSNNSRNKVFFHYYIFDIETGNTIDVGQVAPNDNVKLEFNLAPYFKKGAHKVRIDIRTFKDKAETIEKHPMSYNSTITIY